MLRTAHAPAFLALACVAAAASPALACVADVFTLDRLATESAYVVTASVAEVRSAWTPDHMRIESTVTLTGVQRITRDGAIVEPDITYTVMGGTVDDATLRVGCAPELQVGEQWVLFLQREYRHHPVLGMERGMFRIEVAPGDVARVRSANGDPVVAIDRAGAISVAQQSPDVHDHTADAGGTPRPTAITGNVRAVRIVDRQEAAIRDAGAPVTAIALEDLLAQVRARLPEARAAGPIELVRITPPLAPARLRPALTPQEKTEAPK